VVCKLLIQYLVYAHSCVFNECFSCCMPCRYYMPLSSFPSTWRQFGSDEERTQPDVLPSVLMLWQSQSLSKNISKPICSLVPLVHSFIYISLAAGHLFNVSRHLFMIMIMIIVHRTIASHNQLYARKLEFSIYIMLTLDEELSNTWRNEDNTTIHCCNDWDWA